MDDVKCIVCDMNIEGQYLTVGGKHYHKNHFTCTDCKQPIEGNYRSKDEKPYCSSCHTKNFAKICFGCNEPIDTTVITAMGHTWHKDHFVCTFCKKPLAGTKFMTKDEKPYCNEDYYEKFGNRCDECKLLITDTTITALGKNWHQECFKCGVCSKPVTEKKFGSRDQKPICSACMK